eukprot:scaffold60876_cov44-Cyclotella_meneghiniana.AAC.2
MRKTRSLLIGSRKGRPQADRRLVICCCHPINTTIFISSKMTMIKGQNNLLPHDKPRMPCRTPLFEPAPNVHRTNHRTTMTMKMKHPYTK